MVNLFSSIHYNRKESLIIQSFNPQFTIFHIIKRFIFIVVDFSILITYIEKTNSVWGYLSLYSYWAVSIHLASELFLFIASLIRIVGFYKYNLYESCGKIVGNNNLSLELPLVKVDGNNSDTRINNLARKYSKKNKPLIAIETTYRKSPSETTMQNNFKVILLIFDIIGSMLLVISILQLIISSVSFWICMTFEWDYGYPTIVSHYVVLFLALFDFFTSVIYMYWWGLVWSLFYAGIYYNFSILVFFVYGYWIYDFQDPKKFSGWILLTFITIAAQFVVYILLFFSNLIKTKVFIYLNEHYFKATTLYDEHTQTKTINDYYHTDLFVWGISTILIQFVEIAFSTFGSLILGNNVLIYTIITIQSILFFVNIVHSVVTIIVSKTMTISENSSFKNGNKFEQTQGLLGHMENRVINDTFYLNIGIFIVNLAKLIACIIVFAIYSSEKFVWLFYGIGLFTLMDLYLNFTIYELFEFCFPSRIANNNKSNGKNNFNEFQKNKVMTFYKGGFSYLELN
jgi:hypothetical protein